MFQSILLKLDGTNFISYLKLFFELVIEKFKKHIKKWRPFTFTFDLKEIIVLQNSSQR